MSGGNLDYAYLKVQQAAEGIRSQVNEFGFDISDELKKFADHLDEVAEAMRAVEWYLSGDIGYEQALKSIEQCLQNK